MVFKPAHPRPEVSQSSGSAACAAGRVLEGEKAQQCLGQPIMSRIPKLSRFCLWRPGKGCFTPGAAAAAELGKLHMELVMERSKRGTGEEQGEEQGEGQERRVRSRRGEGEEQGEEQERSKERRRREGEEKERRVRGRRRAGRGERGAGEEKGVEQVRSKERSRRGEGEE